jgi:hypothetical protein
MGTTRSVSFLGIHKKEFRYIAWIILRYTESKIRQILKYVDKFLKFLHNEAWQVLNTCLTGTQRKHVQTHILIIFGGLSKTIAFVVSSPSVLGGASSFQKIFKRILNINIF